MLIISLLLLVVRCNSNLFGNICEDSSYIFKSSSKFHHFFHHVIEKDNNTALRSYVNDSYTVTFGIKQNYDAIKRVLLDVSDPDSSNYRNYLSREEIGLISSNHIYSKKVIDILNQIEGIKIIKTTIDDEYITVQGTISIFEEMFNSKFTKFNCNGKEAFRMKEYSLPKCIHNEIAIVYNVIDNPAHIFVKKKRNIMDIPFKRSLSKSLGAGNSPTSAPTPTLMCKNGPEASCIFNSNVTIASPQYISNLYSIKSNKGSDKVSQGVFETGGQIYSLADLNSFENEFDLPIESIINIGGNVVTAACPNPNDCDEANLDIQYLTAIAQNIPTTGWYESNTNSAFSSWILAMADTKNPPLVMSLSYSTYEGSMSSSDLNQWDTEAMKLGTQGVTIVVSAGDQGVSGFYYQIAKLGNIDWSAYCGYGPQFPATSPYVTSVGGTQGTIEKPAQCDTSGAITTGGGFSNYYPTPSFQENQVNDYFKNVKTQPYENSNEIFDDNNANILLISGTFNRQGRSYPDISCWSSFVYVVISGSIYPIAGTSVSSPVFAAMVSLTNSNNHDHGKRSMGWLNPFLYKYSSEFTNDITTGNNKGLESDSSSSQYFGTDCNVCLYGFYAAPGFDPVSGLGTINFENFSKYAVSKTARLPLTKWQIAVIVVGTMVIVVAFVACIFRYLRKRRALTPSLTQPINESANPITQSQSVEIRNRIE